MIVDRTPPLKIRSTVIESSRIKRLDRMRVLKMVSTKGLFPGPVDCRYALNWRRLVLDASLVMVKG